MNLTFLAGLLLCGCGSFYLIWLLCFGSHSRWEYVVAIMVIVISCWFIVHGLDQIIHPTALGKATGIDGFSDG